MKNSGGDEVFQCEMTPANEAEPEERRLSDMSDWASSVTSNAEIQVMEVCNDYQNRWGSTSFHFMMSYLSVQMNNFSIEQDIFNLRKESEEKDATIKELTNLVQSSNVTGSKVIFNCLS